MMLNYLDADNLNIVESKRLFLGRFFIVFLKLSRWSGFAWREVATRR